jgi:hypothetical protein
VVAGWHVHCVGSKQWGGGCVAGGVRGKDNLMEQCIERIEELQKEIVQRLAVTQHMIHALINGRGMSKIAITLSVSICIFIRNMRVKL